MPIPRGIYPVILTPLQSDQSLDILSFEACLVRYLKTNIAGVTILGSGGELPYFSDNEQYQLVKTTHNVVSAHKALAANKHIIVGVNAYSTVQAIDKISQYTGYCDAILLLLSHYYPVSFNQYYQSILNIAKASTTPILFYYFPQITKVFLSAKQLQAILLIPNIIGMKDSALHIPTAKKILKLCPATLYFSGLSLMLDDLPHTAGAICPLAALYPTQSQKYFQAVNHQTTEQINQYRHQLITALPLINSLTLNAKLQWYMLKILSHSPMPLLKTVASSQAQIKTALRYMGMPINSTVREPLAGISDVDAIKIQQQVKKP